MRALAERGAAVLIAARGYDECERLAGELRAEGARAWPIAVDVADGNSVRLAAAAAREKSEELGPIDWLVNNAGMAQSAPLFPRKDVQLEPFRRHMEVNFHGARRWIEALVPSMKERGYGSVVNVASSAGLRGYAYVSAYCASKFALVGYTLAAAEELRGSGVTLNAVCPHYVDSPMLDQSIQRLVEKTGRSPAQAREFFRGENPGGELVTPDQVAEAVVGLLHDEDTAALVELDGSPEPKRHHPNHKHR